MYMDYRRLFLNWIKQKEQRDTFEFYLQRNNQTLKNHIKQATQYGHLIIFNSFSWIDTTEGYGYWNSFHNDWIDFYIRWTRNHHKRRTYEL